MARIITNENSKTLNDCLQAYCKLLSNKDKRAKQITNFKKETGKHD